MKRLLLVDFMYLWNKLYFISKKNEEVDIKEYILNLLKLIKEDEFYNSVVFVLDSATSTNRRRKLLPQYKRNRSSKEKVYAGITDTINEAKRLYPEYRFITSEYDEADDIIASIVQTTKHCFINIYTGDRDLYQLLPLDYVNISDKFGGGMVLSLTSRDEYIKSMINKYGNKVEITFDITDTLKWKTFKGDPSDNIPVAVPRLPNSIINTLIGRYWNGSAPLSSKILFNMAKYLRKLEPNQFQKFHEHRKDIIRNYKLVQLIHQNHGRILERTKAL